MNTHEYMRRQFLESATRGLYQTMFQSKGAEGLQAVVEDLRTKIPMYLLNFLRHNFPEYLDEVMDKKPDRAKGFFDFSFSGGKLIYRERFTRQEFDVTEKAYEVMDILNEEHESYFEKSPEVLEEFVRILDKGGAGTHTVYVYRLFASIAIKIYREEMTHQWNEDSEEFIMALDFLRVSSFALGKPKNLEFSQFITHYFSDIKYKDNPTFRDLLMFFAYTPDEFLKFLGFTRQDMVGWK